MNFGIQEQRPLVSKHFYCAVVVAAGRGLRMQPTEVPKQYLKIRGKTVLEWALAPFIQDERCKAIAVVLAKDDALWAQLPMATEPKILLAQGGKERVDSVRNGMLVLKEADVLSKWSQQWVMIHDAARPCVQLSDLVALADGVFSMRQSIGGLLASDVTDTIKRVTDGRAVQTISREALRCAQTPQLFPYDILMRAMQAESATPPTDEAEAVERLGYQPLVVPGRRNNIKITTADDLPLAAAILDAQS